MIEYEIDYRELDAAVFIRFVNEIWPGDYDEMKTRSALSKTMNITAWDGEKLVGCLRVLSDGYYFGTITAVSYTHLDVYKRQLDARPKEVII